MGVDVDCAMSDGLEGVEQAVYLRPSRSDSTGEAREGAWGRPLRTGLAMAKVQAE